MCPRSGYCLVVGVGMVSLVGIYVREQREKLNIPLEESGEAIN